MFNAEKVSRLGDLFYACGEVKRERVYVAPDKSDGKLGYPTSVPGVDCALFKVERRLPHTFRDGGVGMNCLDDISGGCVHSDGKRALRDEIGSPWSDNMHAQDLICVGVGDYFYNAFAAIEDQRLSVGSHGDLAYFIVQFQYKY